MTPTFLFKLSIRYSKGHPLQKFLLFLGIAIGVAVVVAVDLANESIGRSFQLSTQSIAGRSTHRIMGAGEGLKQSLYVKLRTESGLKRLAPVVAGYIKLPGLENRSMQLLGIDPFVDNEFRNYLGSARGMPNQDILVAILTRAGGVLIARELAADYGLEPGSSLVLETGKGSKKVVVAGLLDSSNTFTKQALTGLVLTDISTAQEILEMGDRISHIDLMLGADQPESLAAVESLLPAGHRVVSTQQNNNTIRQLSKAFELNLGALSLLALLVGMFLIYNTITFSVIQRRSQLGTLRALGTTRREIFGLIQAETLFWGLLGTLAGLLLGIALGTSLVKLVSRTISDLYFTLTVNTFHLDVLQLLKAFLLGLLASLVSAVFPAWEASRLNPVETLRRSSLEKKITSNLGWLILVGVVSLISGYVLLSVPGRHLGISYGGLLLIVCGSATLIPSLTLVLMKITNVLFVLTAGVVGKVASRNISRSLSRTGVAIASLMIAVSVIIGVGNMVGSFRTTVVNWLSDTIRADLYISTGSSVRNALDETLKGRLQAMADVKQVYTIQTRQIRFGPYANSSIISLNQDVAERKWLWQSGTKSELEKRFQQGWIFISETFAWKHRIKGQPDSFLLLDTPAGQRSFKIAGIFQDFSSEQGIVVVNDSVFKRYWNDHSLFGLSLFVREGVDVETVRRAIESEFGATYNLLIRSNKGLREAAIEVFDRTFTITIALQILAALVAFIGVLNTVMSLMLERAREIGVLRANGMVVSQLWRLVLTESGLIGLLAGLFAIPLGTSLAWILVFIINKRSFGWTLDFVLQPETYVLALVIALAAALLAGIYPVVSMTRRPVAELLRTE